MNNCTLCSSPNTTLYIEVDNYPYYRCGECDLIFQDPKTYLNQSEEKARYDTHQNNPEDEGYRKFLSRMVDPILERVNKGDIGLDYGCGPGPTISVMMAEVGFEVDNYDLYYTPGVTLREGYDFITSTEAFEHFYNPGEEFEKIWSLLKKNGKLGIMTLLQPETEEEFKSWWYKNDPTHVCFFSPKTFSYLAQKYNANVEILTDQVIIMEKK